MRECCEYWCHFPNIICTNLDITQDWRDVPVTKRYIDLGGDAELTVHIEAERIG